MEDKEKTIGFKIEIDGTSQEAQQLAKVELGLKKITKERNDYLKLLQEVERVGGKLTDKQVRELAGLNAAVKKQNETYRDLKKVVDSADDSLNRMRAELIKQKAVYADASAAVRQQMAPAIKKLNDEISKAEQATGVFSRNVGNYSSAFASLPGPLGRAANGVRTLGTAFKALLANPIVLVITAIIGVIAGLVKVFKSTDSGATLFAARFEQIKAILDVVRQRLVNVTDAIGHVFKGEWKQAGESMKQVFTGIGDQLKYATKAAYDYQYALDKTKDAESNYISQSAENKNKIAKLEFTAQDRNKSLEERKKALQDALAIGIQEVKDQRNIAKQKLDNEINYLAGKAGLRSADVLGFIRMTDAEQENASQSLKTLRNNNEDKFDEIEKLYSGWIDLDTKFFEENKRNVSRLSGFEQEEIKNAKDAAAEKLAIEQKFLSDKEKMQKYFFDKWKGLVEDEKNTTVDTFKQGLKELLGIKESDLGLQENKKITDQNKKAVKAAQNYEYEQTKETEDKKLQYKLAAIQGAEMGIAAGFEARKNRLQAQMEAELSQANLTESQKIAIQKKYAKQQQRIDILQAIAGVAIAVVNALQTKPFIPMGLIAAALAGITGAVQIGTIKAQKYASGGKINSGANVNTGTVDDTLIVANKTETVLTRQHVARLGGSGVMRRIGVPGYAEGGYIGSQVPEVMSSGLDLTALARMINDKKVVLEVHKLNKAQSEVNTIMQTQPI